MPLWLLPARDILSVVEILASFWVNEVTWRGHRMAADGTATAMIPEPRAGSRASGGGMKL